MTVRKLSVFPILLCTYLYVCIDEKMFVTRSFDHPVKYVCCNIIVHIIILHLYIYIPSYALCYGNACKTVKTLDVYHYNITLLYCVTIREQRILKNGVLYTHRSVLSEFN